jgi:hypothetical protein
LFGSSTMQDFITDRVERAVRSRGEPIHGVMVTFTDIRIRGNYRKGPVPVSIKYVFRFKPDKQFWEQDAEYPDEEPYPRSIEKAFDTPEERNGYIANHYEGI